MNGGEKVLLDPEDVHFYNEYNWIVSHFNGIPRLVTKVDNHRVSLHRLILGVTDPKEYVEFINGDRFDFRKANLRRMRGRKIVKVRLHKRSTKIKLGITKHTLFTGETVCGGKHYHTGFCYTLEECEEKLEKLRQENIIKTLKEDKILEEKHNGV